MENNKILYRRRIKFDIFWKINIINGYGNNFDGKVNWNIFYQLQTNY
jgi:hypothetical protein